jgi:hypothetical protein
MALTHSMCRKCWNGAVGHERPRPVVFTMPPTETCCFCGATHSDGIYVRGNPDTCKGHV